MSATLSSGSSHARRAAARTTVGTCSRRPTHQSPSRAPFAELTRRVTDVCESAQHEAQKLSELAIDKKTEVPRIQVQLAKNPGEHPGSSPVALIGLRSGVQFPKYIPPFSFGWVFPLLLCPPIPLLESLFLSFSCPKARLREAHF